MFTEVPKESDPLIVREGRERVDDAHKSSFVSKASFVGLRLALLIGVVLLVFSASGGAKHLRSEQTNAVSTSPKVFESVNFGAVKKPVTVKEEKSDKSQIKPAGSGAVGGGSNQQQAEVPVKTTIKGAPTNQDKNDNPLKKCDKNVKLPPGVKCDVVFESANPGATDKPSASVRKEKGQVEDEEEEDEEEEDEETSAASLRGATTRKAETTNTKSAVDPKKDAGAAATAAKSENTKPAVDPKKDAVTSAAAAKSENTKPAVDPKKDAATSAAAAKSENTKPAVDPKKDAVTSAAAAKSENTKAAVDAKKDAAVTKDPKADASKQKKGK